MAVVPRPRKSRVKTIWTEDIEEERSIQILRGGLAAAAEEEERQRPRR